MSSETKYTLALLEAFRHGVWGNDSIFKQSPPPESPTMECLDFGIHLEALRSLCSPLVETDKLLVFQEYRNAMNEFNRQDTLYWRGACISGQPGIGKSMFIAYAVVERLRKKQPVAVQISLDERHDKYVIFCENSVTAHVCTDRSPLKEHPGIWALSDSNEDVKIPTDAFRRTTYVRVFETTSPAESRWKQWTKETTVKRYFMDLPSDEEIKDLARVFEHDAEEMHTFAVKWGRIPRTLLELCKDPRYEETLQETVQNAAGKAAENIKSALDVIKQGDNPNFPGASNIFFARPRKEKDHVDHRRVIALAPTPWIIDILGNAVLRVDIDKQIDFFNVMSLHPDTRGAAGWLFEKVVQHFLIEGDKSMSIQWHENGTERPEIFTPPPSKLCGNVDDLLHTSPPFYWRPRPNFPGIDGALVTEERVFLVQMTLKSTHPSPQVGVDQLWQSPSSKNLKRREWEILFIGSDEHRIKNVANNFAGNVQYGDVATRSRQDDPDRCERRCLPVGHVTIHPNEDMLQNLQEAMGSTGELGASQEEEAMDMS